MKDHLILKDFNGSQNGIDGESFVAGTTRALSDSLVRALGGTASGYVKEAKVAAAEIAKAPPALAEAVLDAIADAEGDGVEVEEKSRGAAPSNKAKTAAPSNKAK